MSKKEIFSKETKEEIVKSYFSGIPIRKLEKLFHKHSSKIKAVLDEYNIDIHDKMQPGGSQKAPPKGYWDIKENMTETEMAKALGYDRIWDCGLIKYVWKKENPGD